MHHSTTVVLTVFWVCLDYVCELVGGHCTWSRASVSYVYHNVERANPCNYLFVFRVDYRGSSCSFICCTWEVSYCPGFSSRHSHGTTLYRSSHCIMLLRVDIKFCYVNLLYFSSFVCLNWNTKCVLSVSISLLIQKSIWRSTSLVPVMMWRNTWLHVATLYYMYINTLRQHGTSIITSYTCTRVCLQVQLSLHPLHGYEWLL